LKVHDHRQAEPAFAKGLQCPTIIELSLWQQCTPWLIWFLGHAARNAVLPLLGPGESTVGVALNVEHTAATPLGAQVVCRARLIYRDGPVVSFQIEAHDEHEQVAGGTPCQKSSKQ
jgi:predicted thioesterase